VDLSIIVPLYNEVDSVPHLHREIHAALDNLLLRWEVIYVDDGSSDGSMPMLERIAEKDPEYVSVVSLRRNFGQTAAMAAGIDHARGEVIVFLDADLQNDPADIPRLLEKLDEGYDVVAGWRKSRRDTWLTRRIPSLLANRLISRVTGVQLHDYGCSLKSFRREIITGFHLYGEMHRFIPVYANWVGAKILEVTVNHRPRQYGKTKYGLNRTMRVILDLITVRMLTRYAAKPMHMIGGLGLKLMLLGLLTAAGGLLHWLCSAREHLLLPLLLLGVIIGLFGVQCIVIGLVAELVARTYFETQCKPAYTIHRVISTLSLRNCDNNRSL